MGGSKGRDRRLHKATGLVRTGVGPVWAEVAGRWWFGGSGGRTIRSDPRITRFDPGSCTTGRRGGPVHAGMGSGAGGQRGVPVKGQRTGPWVCGLEAAVLLRELIPGRRHAQEKASAAPIGRFVVMDDPDGFAFANR